VWIFPPEGQQFTHESGELFGETFYRPTQIQANVKRHLLVTAAARVDFLRKRAGFLFQLANYEGVDGFISRSVKIRGLARFVSDFVKSVDDKPAFIGGQNTSSRKGSGIRLRTLNIGEDEFMVEV